jgi:hypothetical protein
MSWALSVDLETARQERSVLLAGDERLLREGSDVVLLRIQKGNYEQLELILIRLECMCILPGPPKKCTHQKQHYATYYLSIVLILSIKYAFGIISMFFTLVRCSIVLLMFLLTYCIHVSYLMSKFIAFLNIFSCPTRNVPYGKSCLLWNLGLSYFFSYGTVFSSST